MKRPDQSLMDEWNSRLAKEGMPDELPATRRQSLKDVHPDSVRGIADSATFQYWTTLFQAANALPDDFVGRAFLIAYTETGYFRLACTKTGTSRRAGEDALARLAETMGKGRDDDE